MKIKKTVIFLIIFSFVGTPIFAEEAPPRLPTSLSIPDAAEIPKSLGIGLFLNVPSAWVQTNGAYEIRESSEGRPLLFQNNQPLKAKIQPADNGIRINGIIYDVGELVLVASDGWFQVEKRKYHGQVRIVKDSDKQITVVNDVDPEEYLKGVLPLEVHHSWPLEALKAHAVASRTYALFKAIEKKGAPYVLRDTVESQVYGGTTFHKEETDRASNLTRGEILTFGGKIFPSYFHSSCGGHTAQAELIWPVEPNPVLKGVQCSFCRNVKNWKWSLEMPLSEIESIMHQKGYPAKKLNNITFIDRDPSGRASKVILRYKYSKLTLSAGDLRAFIGYDKLRSLKASVTVKNGNAFFHGFGWGHGIGMCQWGTKRQAELGKTYREILEYYFPGSEIRKIT